MGDMIYHKYTNVQKYNIYTQFNVYTSFHSALVHPRPYKGELELGNKSSREDMCRLPTSFLLNIQSRVEQEVDMLQIKKCVTRYSSPY